MTKSVLCIGGPKDRERVTVRHRTSFAVMQPKELSPTEVTEDAPREAGPLVPFVYRKEMIVTPCAGESIELWVAQDLTVRAALLKLMDNYQ